MDIKLVNGWRDGDCLLSQLWCGLTPYDVSYDPRTGQVSDWHGREVPFAATDFLTAVAAQKPQLMTYDDVMALRPNVTPNGNAGATGTTLEYARNFAPGSRTVTIWYGRIPGYRNPHRKSWGFAISDESATWGWFPHYTCPRPSAKRTFENILKPHALERGFVVNLVVDPASGLNADLSQK
jgi:hypothetical protein